MQLAKPGECSRYPSLLSSLLGFGQQNVFLRCQSSSRRSLSGAEGSGQVRNKQARNKLGKASQASVCEAFL